MEVWLEQKSLAKLQKDIDRASTELLDVKRYFGTVKGPYRVGPISGRVGRSLLHTLVLRGGWGSQILFWKYHWDSNGTFQDRYPELFRFARDKEALVSNYLDWVNGQVHWKPVFILEAQDWDLDSMAQFFG